MRASVESIFAEQEWPRLIVRGLYRYEHAGFEGEFTPGALVSIEREPSNAYDPHAVRVLLSDGTMLGYIAKEMAISVSRELSNGVKYVLRIAQSPFVEDKWGQCELDVLFKVSVADMQNLECISRAERNEILCHFPRTGVLQANWSSSPLIDAVLRDDVAHANRLIAAGEDVDQMTFGIGTGEDRSLFFYANPLLMSVRSVDMYKLFVDAGADLHPKFYIERSGLVGMGVHVLWRVYGNEYNLLEELWRGPQMTEREIELADYLVFTEYDKLLRLSSASIRKRCTEGNECSPYKNNVDYVLEWCDMEKAAMIAADELAEREFTGPYSLGHDLMHFLSAWYYEGYETAVRWYKGNELHETEIPPRYVYPERIIRRSFQHEDSGS